MTDETNPIVERVDEKLQWHVARALSIPEHHTTWDTLTEREIAALPDVEADTAATIARQALTTRKV